MSTLDKVVKHFDKTTKEMEILCKSDLSGIPLRRLMMQSTRCYEMMTVFMVMEKYTEEKRNV